MHITLAQKFLLIPFSYALSCFTLQFKANGYSNLPTTTKKQQQLEQ